MLQSQGKQSDACQDMFDERWWARFALPTLRAAN
jgi:hypothetical protein